MSMDDVQPDEVIAKHYGAPELGQALAAWCGGEVVASTGLPGGDEHETILVPTVDGSQRAALGDWIVQSSDGDFSTMRPADFVARHAPTP